MDTANAIISYKQLQVSKSGFPLTVSVLTPSLPVKRAMSKLNTVAISETQEQESAAMLAIMWSSVPLTLFWFFTEALVRAASRLATLQVS